MNETVERGGWTSRAQRSDFARFLLAFAGLGLLAGLLEASVLLLICLIRGHFLFVNPNFLWMTPLAEALVFLGLAGLLLLCLQWLPRWKALSLSAGALCFVAALSVLGSSRLLSFWAVVLFAAGVGVQAGRFAAKHPAAFLRWGHRGAGAFAIVVLLLAAATFGRQFGNGGAAGASVGTAGTVRPNVLLVVLDTVRADSLGAYGSAVPTPEMDALAASGIVFENALATSPWTLPSHASMFTGYYPHELSADWFAPLDTRHPTLAEVLSSAGYATSGFVANERYCARNTGLNRGFAHYDDFTLSTGDFLGQSYLIRSLAESPLGLSWLGIYEPLGETRGPEVTDGFLAWLDRNGDRPFFAFLNYFDAHDPYLPGRLVAEDRELTRDEKMLMRNWWRRDPRTLSGGEQELARSCYAALIQELDREVGRLVEGLRQRGLLEDTLIVLTSDHGEMFGEHGVYHHGNSLHRPVIRVPLVLSWPSGMAEPARHPLPVTLRDLPATIHGIVGASGVPRFPGESLSKYWQTEGTPLEEAPGRSLSSPIHATVNPHPRPDVFLQHRYSPAASGTMDSLLQDQLHLIRDGAGVEEMYRFSEDPGEEHDLVDRPEFAEQREAVSAALDRLLEEQRGAIPAD